MGGKVCICVCVFVDLINTFHITGKEVGGREGEGGRGESNIYNMILKELRDRKGAFIVFFALHHTIQIGGQYAGISRHLGIWLR